jgi:hypothetical protein
MRKAALLALVPLVAACNIETRNPTDGDENVTIAAQQNGQVSFNLPFAKGQVKFPDSAMDNSKFEIDGVRMMPGSKMTGFNLDSSEKGTAVQMAFSAPASPDAVRAYFIDQFRDKGVEAKAEGSGVSGTSKDGETFVIDVQPAAQGSTGTVTIQSND